MNEKITMITFTLDGKNISVPKGTTVFHAAKEHGIEIPIFCYQDRMPPFGACRVCLVEVEKMGKLQTSCTLEATEGMVVKTQTAMAQEGRRDILELLLINHPLDCPICDRGGECPLQDQTLKYGPGLSRFFEEKRKLAKHLSLGPVLILDRERCITCARCTRFGDLIAGDHALEFKERGYRTEVGTPNDEPVQSKFIGNTIMICPVGALTSQVYRFRARPWDNEHTQTTCTLCPVGCSEILDSRDGEIMRTRSCENKNVNDIWLCDKGWFGYQFVDHPDRLTQPLIRENGNLVPATWKEAISLIAMKIKQAKPKGKLAALGGNPLTIEENYLFQKLMRAGAGVNHIDHRVGMPIIDSKNEGIPSGMEISIGECENLSFAILLGIDITEEFPVIWLRLKQAINKGAIVIFAGHFAPEISTHLSKTILHAPGQELTTLKQYLPQIAALAEKGKGAIFVGNQYLNSPSRLSILSELNALRLQKSSLSLNIMEGRGNSAGAQLAGMRPDKGPLGQSINEPGFNCQQIIEAAASSGWDYLHVAGSDPVSKLSSNLWKKAREGLQFLIVQDIFLTETAKQADVVLPTRCFVEKQGSFINIEGRIQKLKPGKALPDRIYSDGEIFALIASELQISLLDDPAFNSAISVGHLPQRSLKKIELPKHAQENVEQKSGQLYASFAYSLFDHGVRMCHNEHLVKLVKEPKVRLHPLEAITRNIKNDDLIEISANGRSIKAKVHLDERIAAHTIVLPLGFPEVPVHELSDQLVNGLCIEVKGLR